MDTIIYVVYREIKINSGSREENQQESVRIEQFPMGKDFQIIHLTVSEKCAVTESMVQRLKTGKVRQFLRGGKLLQFLQAGNGRQLLRAGNNGPQFLRAGNGLQYLADQFPGMRARRLQRERNQLIEQIRARLVPLLDRWGDNTCMYAKCMQVQNESARIDTAQRDTVQRDTVQRKLVPKKYAKRENAKEESSGAWLPQALGNEIPEFQGYWEFCWMDRLLPYAKQEHFLALGTAGCIGQVFERLAPRAKSLLWIVPDYTYKAQVEAVAERLYEEYGLAVDLRFLPEGAVFSRIQISGKYLTEPLNVLDFTGEKYVPPLALAPGSVWLDIGAVEEKEKRIKGRRMPVEYVSLRTIVKHPDIKKGA